MRSSSIIIVLLLVVVGILGWMLWVKPVEAPSIPNERTASGNTDVGTTETPSAAPLHDRVSITYPAKHSAVPKKFTVTGNAPGNWFFEASAPVMIVDPEGNKLAQTVAQTLSDWMTTELVPFEAKVDISGTYTGPATLVFLKDNPSGLPENEDSFEIPINIQ